MMPQEEMWEEARELALIYSVSLNKNAGHPHIEACIFALDALCLDLVPSFPYMDIPFPGRCGNWVIRSIRASGLVQGRTLSR